MQLQIKDICCHVGGLMFKLPESNLQYVASITFLLTTYSKYMSFTKHTFNCGNDLLVTPTTLRSLAKRQASPFHLDIFLHVSSVISLKLISKQILIKYL